MSEVNHLVPNIIHV